jgi:hypothetical protein
VVAGEDDEATILNHTLIQGRRRYRRNLVAFVI